MDAGDELYDDNITSGPATDTCAHGVPWNESCHAGQCFRERDAKWPGDRDRDYDPLEDC